LIDGWIEAIKKSKTLTIFPGLFLRLNRIRFRSFCPFFFFFIACFAVFFQQQQEKKSVRFLYLLLSLLLLLLQPRMFEIRGRIAFSS